MYVSYVFKCLCLCMSLQSTSTSLASLDINYPFLMSDTQILRFHEGGGAFMLASNHMIRLNYRGIQFLPSTQLVIENNYKGWLEYSCNASMDSLCTTEHGRVFPSTTPLVGLDYSMQCLKSTGKQVVNQLVYDISACDILDESVEVIYTPGKMFRHKSYMPTPLYMFYVMCCIYLVRSLSLNIINKLDPTVEIVQYPTVGIVLVITLCMLVDGDGYYATADDLLLYWLTILYIIMYMCFHAYHIYYNMYNIIKITKVPRVFNMSAATLQLVVMRLYGSAETPYAGVIIGIIATRIWEKELNKKTAHIFTGLLDCIYLSLLMQMGFSYARMYLFPLLVAAKVLAVKLQNSHVKK